MKKSYLINIIREEIENLLEQPDSITTKGQGNTYRSLVTPGGKLKGAVTRMSVDRPDPTADQGPPLPIINQIILRLSNIIDFSQNWNRAPGYEAEKLEKEIDDIIGVLSDFKGAQ